MNAKNGGSDFSVPEQIVFGKVIDGLRSHKGLTQTDLAVAAGISNAALSRLERGDSNPSLGTILALARGLDLAPHRLMVAYEQSMSGAKEQLEEVVGSDLSKAAVTAGLAGLGAASRGKAALHRLVTGAVVGSVVAGPVGLVVMAVASAISVGVFGALANFVSTEKGDEEDGSCAQR